MGVIWNIWNPWEQRICGKICGVEFCGDDYDGPLQCGLGVVYEIIIMMVIIILVIYISLVILYKSPQSLYNA